MKKSIIPLGAVVLAILYCSFAIRLSTFNDYYIFQYDGTDDYLSRAAVENEANWDFVSTDTSDLDAGCNGTDMRACRIKVHASYVNTQVSPATLKTTANVKSAMFDGWFYDTYYVILTGSNVSGKIN